jgi:hypothetical protein
MAVKSLSKVEAEDRVEELWQDGEWEEQGRQKARRHVEECAASMKIRGGSAMHAIRLEAWRARRILVYGGMHTGVLAGMQQLEVRDRLRNEGLRIRAGISHACMRRMRTCTT